MSRSQTKDDNRAIQEDEALRVAEVRAKDVADREVRAQRLKELQAKQKARSAGTGAGTSGGSSAALLRGLRKKALTEDELAVEERELAIRGIKQRAATQQRRNLLESDSRLVSDGVRGAFGLGRSLLDL
ncbi:MAG: hypothetical protein AAFX81_00930 [Pseudomonadota bacterium]